MAGRLGGRGGRGGFQASEGDWPCPNPGCSNVNFARRDKCNRCQTPRPEGAGGAGGPKPAASLDFRGPPGLFQAGDWACNTCGNVNWERRNDCNICKSPKPGMSGLDEKRDGAGGGFNERQERVASARAEVDEDGYDDFGIKKKKVKASKAEREAAALARLKQSYSGIIQAPGSVAAAVTVPSSSTSRQELPTYRDSKPTASEADKAPSSATTQRDGDSEKKRRSWSPERSRRDPSGTSRRSRSRDRDRSRDPRSRRSTSRDRIRSRQRSRSRSRGRDHRDNRRR